MASVLLVDDERNIRNGLSAMISRSGSIFTDISECSNGADALELLSERKYDLLITDLLMPQMGGMDLVASMEDMAAKPHTVILSGHDDFKFAQKAISYGVMAYLLKPVDRNELIHVLKKAEADILMRQNAQVSTPAGDKETLQESRVKALLLERPMNEDDASRLERETLTGYRVAVLNFCGVYEAAGKRENNAALESLVKKQLRDAGSKGCCLLDQNANVVLLHGSDMDIETLLDELEKATSMRCAAGVSSSLASGRDLHTLYLQAEYALRCRLLYPSERMLRSEKLADMDGRYVLPVRLLKSLSMVLDTVHKEDLAKLVDQIFDIATMKKYRLDYTEKLAQAFKDEIIQTLSESIPHRVDFIREQDSAFKSIYEFPEMREYVKYIRGTVMNINGILIKNKNVCIAGNEIDRAIRYVKENYSKDLTMAEVANRISLNYSYFSLLFKGKTGMNFIDYLKTLRIEKAKELLRSTDYKIYEISGMVGYNNTKHFTTTFRTFTGISPREYRDSVYSVS